MDESELNAILADRDSVIPEQSEQLETITPVENEYTCKFPGCGKTFKDKFGLMGHSRTHKKDKDNAVEQKEAKLPSVTLPAILPENLTYLRGILKSFSAKNIDNIIYGMQDNPESIDEL